ncbi:hypothetical protein AVEN_8833-1 [Araneus ventricosus]|uniref:Pre-C2HC domain-containing protein n=1 Tax=Araneus ventricosus TaxID=182803 RepID=A0A4Y2E4H4_ARAVE|nr:hypothetical protein AVEN_8833-1 [Araneus ventricosus]
MNLRTILTFKKIQHCVVPSRAKKPIQIVIRGLPRGTETEEIKEGLIKKVFNVAKVIQLRRFRDKKPLDIFQVHLLKSENVKEIYSLDNLIT